MADYSIIADVEEAIIRLLREGLVPAIIPNSEGIGVCSPSDKGDVSLGIYLYDIRRNPSVRSERVSTGTDSFRSPSLFLDLYFMITAYSSGDIRFRSLEEAKILGRTLQILEGTSVFRGNLFGKPFSDLQYEPRMELLEPELEEKNRIWNMPNVPYRLSLFYKVYPIELISEKITKITRVRQTDITLGQIHPELREVRE